MPVVIENLQVTIRVKTAQRAPLSQVDEKKANSNRVPERVHLMAPPKSAAVSEAPLPLMEEEKPGAVASAAEDVDLNELSERVYEYLRYDIRVSRERRGLPR